MQYYKFNESGYYLEPVIAEYDDDNPMPDDVTDVRPPDGLYRGQWTGAEWIEAAPMPEHDPETELALWDYEYKTWTVVKKDEFEQSLTMEERVTSLEEQIEQINQTLRR